jgi:hypothetical protein
LELFCYLINLCVTEKRIYISRNSFNRLYALCRMLYRFYLQFPLRLPHTVNNFLALALITFGEVTTAKLVLIFQLAEY